MSLDIKHDKYIYLRYYNDKGDRINLYLGKIIKPGEIDVKKDNITKASQYFYKQGFQNYKIGELLESNPVEAIRILTEKKPFNESELMEWLKRQHIPVGSTGKLQKQKVTPQTGKILRLAQNIVAHPAAAAASPDRDEVEKNKKRTRDKKKKKK